MLMPPAMMPSQGVLLQKQQRMLQQPCPTSCKLLQPLGNRPRAAAYVYSNRRSSNLLPCRSAAASTQAVSHSRVAQEVALTDASALQSASQPYINKFVKPLSRGTLHVYKYHEDIFDQLLRTPDLDKQLKQGNAPLQWATAAVEAAVADAIDIAYISGTRSHSTSPVSRHGTPAGLVERSNSSPAAANAAAILAGRDSPVQSPMSSTESHDKKILFSDGMDAVDSPSAATAAGSSFDSGCSGNDDEECEVDWTSMLSDEEEGPGASSPALATAFAASGAGNGVPSSSMDAITDELAARGAVKVEQATQEAFDVAAAHIFLQRVLYKINRLNHFWFDDLHNYVNERSAWLAQLRDRIEEPWQAWEQQQMAAAAALEKAEEGGSGGAADTGVAAYQNMSLEEMKEGLRDRYARDVDPPFSPALQYVAHSMGPLGYCHLLAVGSVDGLVEASRQSRVCAGAANEVSCAIFRVLMEEYGTGRFIRKHSTFYKAMMQELGLNTKEEHYLDLLPWQWLAAANHNFLITERRRHYLRYAGALTFFEINGPSVYKAYLSAGKRCGLSDDASGYWALHIKEDERHGRQMLEEVALPLVDMYPHNAWELLWGYDQDRFMGARAGAALVGHIQAAASLARELTAAASGSSSAARAGQQELQHAVQH